MANGVSIGTLARINFGAGIIANTTSGALRIELDSSHFLSTAGGTITGNLTLRDAPLTLTGTSTIDGRKPSVDGAILDLINSGSGIVARTANGTFTHITLQGTTDQILVSNGAGAVNPTISLPSRVRFPGTDGVLIPRGNTAQRPTDADVGLVRVNTETGRLEVYYADGAWHHFILDNDPRVFEPHIITVSAAETEISGGFTSVKSAMDSITNSSIANRYIIDVHPGIYYEDKITFKPYVTIRGSSDEQTAIIANSQNDHLIEAALGASITNCYLGMVSDFVSLPQATGKALIHCGLADTSGTAAFYIEDCHLGPADYLILVEQAAGTSATVYAVNVVFGGTDTFNNGFVTRGPGIARINLRSGTTVNGVLQGISGDLFLIDGTQSTIVCTSGAFRSNGTKGTGLRQRNGGTSRFIGVSLFGFAKGVWVENVGAAPTVSVTGSNLQNNTQDLLIEHPATKGQFSGSAARSKTSIASTATISVQFLDPEATGTTLIGPMFIGKDYASTVNVTDLIAQGGSMGVISGGVMTNNGGLTIKISAGYGYVDNGGESGPGTLTRFDWPDTTMNVPANTVSYVYMNTAGGLGISQSPPDPLNAMIFGRIVTEGAAISWIENVPTQGRHPANYINRAMRQAIGPIFQTGSTLSANTASSARNLAVTAGVYWFGGTRFSPSGGNPIKFRDYYHSNATTWTYTANVTTVDNTQYDNGSGLTSLSANAYVKHSLYTVGEGANELYMLVRGQIPYNSLVEAEAAALPTPPPSFGNAMALIGSVVLQSGRSTIVEVLDNRPTIGGKTAMLSAAAHHSNLLGLDSDDHQQYLRVDGGRAFAGTLQMAGNPIANAGTINGVTITSLAARHTPNGADPLPTAAPTVVLGPTTPNAEGVANSFARSDHTHSITGVQPFSAELSALANLASTGFVVRSAAGAYLPRSLSVSSDLTVANPDGVAGNPLVSLSNTTVTPGTWNTVRVDAKGRVVAGSNTAYLTQNQTVTLSGDVTGAGTTAIIATLANSGVTPGTYGPLHSAIVDAKGRVTNAVAYSVTGDFTFSGTTLGLTSISGLNAGSYTLPSITVDAKGRITSIVSGTIALTGDVTGTGGANVPTTLSATGVAAGTYSLATVTVDAKGRVINATSGTAQPPSGELTAISALSSTGIMVRTGASAYALRALAGAANQISVTNPDGVAGNPTVALAANPVLPGTSGFVPPIGTTALRPTGTALTQAQTRFNTDSSALEYYDGAAWKTVLATSATYSGPARWFAAYSTSSATVPSTTTFTLIPWNVEQRKDVIFTHALNSTSVTVSQAGWYRIIADISITGSGAEISVFINGVSPPNGSAFTNQSFKVGGYQTINMNVMIQCVAGDVITMGIRLQSGGNAQILPNDTRFYIGETP